MSAAMMIGMAVGMPIYRAIAGISSAEQYRLYPVPSVTAMALTMAVPMAGWMLLPVLDAGRTGAKGHHGCHCAEDCHRRALHFSPSLPQVQKSTAIPSLTQSP